MKRVLLVFSTVALIGCAHEIALRGDSEASDLALHVEAGLDGARGRVKIVLDNRSDDPVGVDVDRIRLRDGKGQIFAALGAEQKFRGGEAGTRRVPHGSINVPPRQRQTIELEFENLPPAEAAFSVVLPELFSLGIEGQIALKPVRVQLKVVESAPRSATVDGGFYDPFVQ